MAEGKATVGNALWREMQKTHYCVVYIKQQKGLTERRTDMSTIEKDAEKGKRFKKKWLVVGATILAIALAFTCLSWRSMHPEESITIEELQKGAEDGSVVQIDCVNGSYIVLVENEKNASWYRISAEETEALDEQIEKIAADAEIMLTRENVTLPYVFLVYVVQFSICYGAVWVLWFLYGKLRIGKRKEHYRR